MTDETVPPTPPADDTPPPPPAPPTQPTQPAQPVGGFTAQAGPQFLPPGAAAPQYNATPAWDGLTAPTGQAAPAGYTPPVPGGYTQPTPAGYAQPTSAGYTQPVQGGYTQPGQAGYAPPGYTQAPPGYTQAPPPGYGWTAQAPGQGSAWTGQAQAPGQTGAAWPGQQAYGWTGQAQPGTAWPGQVPPTGPAPSSHRGRTIAIVAIALVAALGIGLFAAWFIHRSQTPESPPTTLPPSSAQSSAPASTAPSPTPRATPTPAAPASSAPAPASGDAVPVGTDGTSGDTTYHINSATVSSALIDGWWPSEEGTFVLINLTVTYNGDDQFPYFTGYEVEFVTADGRRYQVSPASLLIDDTLYLTECPPGQPVTGVMAFDVPA
ncbi:MAG: DUF4352 domain-containing protein, partial [Propionibacteriaceae bacterium]|nr:DUF4352 domain-containing protein [Propionibacteriaceae bacterium]